jgi:hypothetical protein
VRTVGLLLEHASRYSGKPHLIHRQGRATTTESAVGTEPDNHRGRPLGLFSGEP